MTAFHEGRRLASYAADAALPPEVRRERHGEAFLVEVKVRPPAPGTNAQLATREMTNQPSEFQVQAVRKGDRSTFPHVTLGRAPNNDVVLADASVAPFQAYFRKSGAAWHLHDTSGHEATKVDGIPVPAAGGRSVVLAPGARLRFGEVELMFLPELQFWALVNGAVPRR